MKTFICGLSALEYWQSLRCAVIPSLSDIRPVERDSSRSGRRQVRSCLLCEQVPSDAELQTSLERAPCSLAEPLDLLASTDGSAWQTPRRTRHSWRGPLSHDSAVKIAHGVYVAAPEFLYLQLSMRYELELLTLLGYELCGSYALPVRCHGGSGSYPCMQATTAARFRRYLSSPALDHVHGIVRARRAASFVTETSNSPRESAMIMLLCLPRRYGGYGIELPSMNVPIDVPTKLERVIGRKWFSIDAYWPAARYGVEYDGMEGHTGSANVARDYVRGNALSAMGITVSTISAAQLGNPAMFHVFASQVCRALGVRLRRPSNESAWKERNARLRSAVLNAHRWE
jgi:hypothetical protein